MPLQTRDYSEMTFADILNSLRTVTDTDGRRTIVNVDRCDVLDGAFRAFGRKNFDAKTLLSVRFIGEDGIDSGGVTREFLRLAVRSVKDLPIFIGPDHSKTMHLDYRGKCCRMSVNVCPWYSLHACRI